MTSPFWGFSLAVSGRTMPLAVVSSSSIARTISRSPRGLSFMCIDLRLRGFPGTSWHSAVVSARPAAILQRWRAPATRRWHSWGRSASLEGAPPGRPAGARTASVLGAADPQPGVRHARRVLDDLREAHDGDDVVHRDPAAVDLLEEVDHLVVTAELGVVVLDLPGREVLHALDLDLVDDRLEDLLAGRVLIADR